MSIELARAYVQIVPSMKGVQSSISKEFGGVGGALDKQATSVGKHSGSLLQAGLVGGLAGGVVNLAGAAIGRVAGVMTDYLGQAAAASDATDKFKQTLQFAGLKTTAIDAATKRTQAYADATVYDLGTIQNTTAQLAANGVKNYAGLTEAAGNLNAVAGGNADTFGSVAMVLTQTAGAGKLTTENYNQLADAIPGASGILQKALKDNGAYTGNFRDAMQKGEITADEFNKAILQVGNKPVAVEAAKSTKTFEGAIGSLQATIVGGLSKALTAIKPTATAAITGLSSGIAAAFQGIGNVVQAIGPPASAIFSKLGSILTPLLPIIAGLAAGFVGFLVKTNLPAIVARLATSFGPVAGVLGQAAGALRFLTGPVGILITLFTAAYASSATFRTTINGLVTTVLGLATSLAGQLMPVITQVVSVVAGSFRSTFATLLPVVAQLATVLGQVLSQALTALSPLLTVVVGVVGQLLTAVAPVIGAVVGLAGSLLGALLPVVSTLIGAVLPVFVSLVRAIVPVLSAVIAAVLPVVQSFAQMAAQLVGQLVPVILQLVRSVLPLIVSVLRTILPAVLPVVQILGTVLTQVIRALLPVVSSVFGAIVPIIRAAVQIVSGVLNVVIGLLTGNFSQAFRGLGQIVSGAFNLVVSAIRGAVGIVGAAIGAVVNIVKATFKGAIDAVVTIGGQIVAGLVQGFRSAFTGALNTIKGLINLLPQGVRDLLGIHSPSRVFAQIGRYVAQGLADGLAGSQDQVQSASEKLVNGVTDAFAKLVSNREAAQKRLAKLNTQLSRTSTKTQAGRNRASDLRGEIAEQKAAIDAAKAPGGTKGFVAALKADTDQITALAGRRDKLADQLKTAQDDLTSAIKVRDDFRDQIQQTSIGLGNIVDAFNSVADARSKATDAIDSITSKIADLGKSQADAQKDADSTQTDLAKVTAQLADLSRYGSDYADKISDLTDKRDDLAGKLADQMAKVAGYVDQTATAQSDLARAQADAVQASSPKIISTLQAAVTNTNAFRDTLAQLRSQGLDDTTYSQLLQGGVAGGGLQAAQELAAAGPGVVQQVRDLQSQLSVAGKALGTDASTVLYQAGVDTAQASVDGIKAKIVDNQAAIGLLELAIADRVKVLGINTSALTKDAGKQFTAGLADGIYGASSDLDAVIDALGEKTVKRLRKKLGIKSPSRVTAEIGRFTGLGFVQGIAGQQDAAEAAMNDLVSIPTAPISAANYAAAPAEMGTGGGVTQVFNGPMGFSRDEVADHIATKARRVLNGVNIPKVSVR